MLKKVVQDSLLQDSKKLISDLKLLIEKDNDYLQLKKEEVLSACALPYIKKVWNAIILYFEDLLEYGRPICVRFDANIHFDFSVLRIVEQEVSSWSNDLDVQHFIEDNYVVLVITLNENSG
jgi:hypothetical protein